MSWASLASNEIISFNDLQDAVTTGALPATGTGIPATDECVTKADIGTYVHNQIDDPAYIALASNEELTKQDCVNGTCQFLVITVTTADRFAADDGTVRFYLVDCCSAGFELPVNVNRFSFNTGIPTDSRYSSPLDVGPFILVGGVLTPCSGGSTYSFTGYTSGCISN